jgi:hypothetical protein
VPGQGYPRVWSWPPGGLPFRFGNPGEGIIVEGGGSERPATPALEHEVTLRSRVGAPSVKLGKGGWEGSPRGFGGSPCDLPERYLY